MNPRTVVILMGILMVFSQNAFSTTLFDEADYHPLIADQKAFFQGDLLTVIILETSNAESNAHLSSNKKIKAGLEAGIKHHNEMLSFGLNGEGQGNAKTTRGGKIKATITAHIIKVHPKERYEIEGQQQIQINGERQTIEVHGIVRAQDIFPDNTVFSTRLGNAHIIYTGIGDVANAHRNNFLYRSLSWIGVI